MTDITDRRKQLGRRVTDRRNQPATEAQRYSSGENFAIFILRGIQSNIRNPRIEQFVGVMACTSIYQTCENEINRIKHMQDIRKHESGGK